MAEDFDLAIVFAAGPGQERTMATKVASGTTIGQAIAWCGILASEPDIDLATVNLGVWGRGRRASDLVNPGDRIEIYRQLLVTPQAARRARANKNKLKKASAPTA